MTAADTARVLLIRYERIARANRPDWAAFVVEARHDPALIAYEVAECADAAIIDEQVIDAVFDIVADWVAALRGDDTGDTCPDCGAPTYWSDVIAGWLHHTADPLCFLAAKQEGDW